jgi:3-oxoacyl-[acyl-carrier protein] reductase
MARLDGKVAIVTGGAKGLGGAMAVLFANEGAHVIAADMAPLSYEHERVEFKPLNVTDVEACKALTEYAKEKYGHIDILVNNAGITKDGMTYKMTDDMWDAVIAVNLKGVFNLTRFVGPLMESQGAGSIINISSIVGEYGNIGQINYAATKAGLIA